MHLHVLGRQDGLYELQDTPCHPDSTLGTRPRGIASLITCSVHSYRVSRLSLGLIMWVSGSYSRCAASSFLYVGHGVGGLTTDVEAAVGPTPAYSNLSRTKGRSGLSVGRLLANLDHGVCALFPRGERLEACLGFLPDVERKTSQVDNGTGG